MSGSSSPIRGPGNPGQAHDSEAVRHQLTVLTAEQFHMLSNAWTGAPLHGRVAQGAEELPGDLIARLYRLSPATITELVSEEAAERSLREALELYVAAAPHEPDRSVVRRRILELCRSQQTSLDLCGLEFSRLPESISALNHLKTLNLYLCKSLTSLEGLQNLTNLQTLDLSWCRNLTSLEGLENLTNLQTLDLSRCDRFGSLQGRYDSPDAVGELIRRVTSERSLRDELDRYVDEQPDEAGRSEVRRRILELFRSQDTSLDLGELEFSRLPESISALSTLKTLVIGENAKLTTLDELPALPNLQTLELHVCNSLTSLEGLENLTNLQTLYLRHCPNLTTLQGLQNLQNLQTLELHVCNSLTSLEGLQNLPNLQNLELGGCKSLTSLEKLENLTNLQKLNLSWCEGLTSLEGLENLTNLQKLYLSGCESLTSLEGLQNLPTLQDLDLSGCESLTSLEGLENASMECRVVGIPDRLQEEYKRMLFPQLDRQVAMLDLLRRASPRGIPNADFEDFQVRALKEGDDPDSWEAQVLKALDEQPDQIGIELKKAQFSAICDLIRNAPATNEFSQDEETRKRQFLEFGYRINRLLERWSSQLDTRDRAPFLNSDNSKDLANSREPVCLTGWNQRIRQWEDDPTCPDPDAARGQLQADIPPLLKGVELGAKWRRTIEENQTEPAVNRALYNIREDDPLAAGVNVHTAKACKNLLNQPLALGLSDEDAPPDEWNNDIVKREIDRNPMFLRDLFWRQALKPEQFRVLIDQLQDYARSHGLKLYEAMEPLVQAYGLAAAADSKLALSSDAINEVEKLKGELQQVIAEKNGVEALRILRDLRKHGLKVSLPLMPKEEAFSILDRMLERGDLAEDVEDKIRAFRQSIQRLMLERGDLAEDVEDKIRAFRQSIQRQRMGDEDTLKQDQDKFKDLPELRDVLKKLEAQADDAQMADYYRRVLASAENVLGDWTERMEPLHAGALRDAVFLVDDDDNYSLTDFGAKVWLALTGQPLPTPVQEARVLKWLRNSPEAQQILQNAVRELERNLPNQ